MKKIILSAFAMGMVSVAASAQDVGYAFDRKVSPDRTPQVWVDNGWATQTKVSFQAKVTPNAPYSAEATTESVMTLADGNRIMRKGTTRVYRDSAGRTRQETVGTDGQVTSMFISDPVAKTNYSLDPRSQTASPASVFYAVTHLDSEPVATGTISQSASAPPSTTLTLSTASGAGTSEVRQVQKSVIVTASEGSAFKVEANIATRGEATKEDLGEQTIEGVLAKGTRTTTVIPAGAVDNEQPIRIVSEEWFSPELQVLVLTRHSDPRVGDTTYRLTNVTRTEPARSLFELPAGYTVKNPEPVTHSEYQKR